MQQFTNELTAMNTNSLINFIAAGGMNNEQATIAANLLVDRIHAPVKHTPIWRRVM